MHRYAPQYRPPGVATVPAGWRMVEQGRNFRLPLRPDVPLGDHPFGVIEYEEPLTDEQRERFDLVPA